MACLLRPTGFVATVRLEQPEVEVGDGTAAHILHEQRLEIAGLQEADVGAEPLNGADAGERGDQGLGHAGVDEMAGLGDVGELLRPRLERHMEDLGAERRNVLGLPRLDGRHPVQRAGRHVGALGIEAAVTPHPTGKQWLGDRVGRQQLGLGVVDLRGRRHQPQV